MKYWKRGFSCPYCGEDEPDVEPTDNNEVVLIRCLKCKKFYQYTTHTTVSSYVRRIRQSKSTAKTFEEARP